MEHTVGGSGRGASSSGLVSSHSTLQGIATVLHGVVLDLTSAHNADGLTDVARVRLGDALLNLEVAEDCAVAGHASDALLAVQHAVQLLKDAAPAQLGKAAVELERYLSVEDEPLACGKKDVDEGISCAFSMIDRMGGWSDLDDNEFRMVLL